MARAGECAASGSPSVRFPRGWENTRVHQLRSSKADRDQILAAFVSAMFPLASGAARSSFLGTWLWHVPPRLGQNSVLDAAAQSFALAYFARLSRDVLLLRRAELSYVVALRSLATAIADPDKRLDSEVLCAVMLLGHYEVRTISSLAYCSVRS